MTDDEKYAQERREREEKYAQETTERDVRQKYLDEIVKAAMERVMVAIAGRLPTVKVHFFYGLQLLIPSTLSLGMSSAATLSGRLQKALG